MNAIEPRSCWYQSQGLRLHYVDWGNASAPPLILIHGGGDHCRSWDALARALQSHFHVIAPDLRGHGDSEWAKGGSYPLSEYVYDLTRLVQAIDTSRVSLIGHSMGGMVSLIYTGAFPERVSSLVVLDGVTVLPGAGRAPPHERIAKWVDQLDKLHDRAPRRYPSLEAAATQMQAHNKRLSRDLALHLATYGTRQNADGTYSWKFDPYQRAAAPQRLWPEDHVALWSRIACPTLLINAAESFLGGSRAAGLAQHFPNARIETVPDAGHWLQHDKPGEVLALIRNFLPRANPK